jgi:transposase
MNASTRFDTEVIGSLPILVEYLGRLKLAETIDKVVPWDGDVPLGTLTEVLVLNRLLNPKAMFRIDDWAQASGVAAYYGLEPNQLNDDRLGRALERLAAHTDTIQAPLVLQAVKGFDLDVSQIHYDLTSIEFYGAYEQAVVPAKPPDATPETPAEGTPANSAEGTPANSAEGTPANPTEGTTTPLEGAATSAPQPTYGRSKSGRKHVKQIQAGINVTGDGAVPVAHAAFDGNTAESTTYAENVRRLKEILPKSDLLYIADTKLDTQENLWEVVDAKGKFLCGGAFNVGLQQRFLKHYQDLQPVKYWPKSQEKWEPEERDQYQAFELKETLERIVDGKKQKHDYRVVFVWSESKERQEIKTRERHVAKIRAEFEAIERNLNRYTLKDEKTILRRLEKAKGLYSEGSLFDYTLAGKQGSYTLTWGQNAKALEEWKKLEGVFVLKTNLSSRKLPLGAALAKYREQINVEKRIGNLKGPLAVAPMFLEKPERIAGLLSVLVWALMAMSLMERAARKSLKGKPLYGLYPENRPSPAPTGPAILDCFSTLCIVIVQHKHTQSRHLAELTATQLKLLKLLGIPPSTLKAFKRSSGILGT